MKFLTLLVATLAPLCAMGSVVLQQNDMPEGDLPVKTIDGWEWTDCGMFVTSNSTELSLSTMGLPGDSTDPVEIKSIEISPDPPKPGQDLTVKVTLTAKEEIEVCPQSTSGTKCLCTASGGRESGCSSENWRREATTEDI